MFGTDTGYLTDYSMDEEYRQLGLAGLSFRDVLAMLTTNPAQRFGVLTGRAGSNREQKETSRSWHQTQARESWRILRTSFTQYAPGGSFSRVCPRRRAECCFDHVNGFA